MADPRDLGNAEIADVLGGCTFGVMSEHEKMCVYDAARRLRDKEEYLKGCRGTCPCLSRPPIVAKPFPISFDADDE